MNMAALNFSILLADDNEMNRWLLAEQLGHWSNDITQACHGREAWERLQEHDYDLVFADVNMPLMDGFELIDRVRQQLLTYRAMFVAVTAHAHSQQQQTLLQRGYDTCLIKPIVLSDLQTVITRYQQSDSQFDAEFYANALLDRVDNNRQLGVIMLKKLFEQLPSQLDAVEAALRQRQYRQAWAMAHKAHGGLCFFGFEDFRVIAAELEQSLLDGTPDKAEDQLQILQQKFRQLMDNRAKVFARVA